jgi:hypothetical protein
MSRDSVRTEALALVIDVYGSDHEPADRHQLAAYTYVPLFMGDDAQNPAVLLKNQEPMSGVWAGCNIWSMAYRRM